LQPLPTKKKIDAIHQVIPDFDRLKRIAYLPPDGKDSVILYYGYKNDSLVGVAVETYSERGFSGHIGLMVGFKADGTINSIEVLEQKETPGLGTKMTEPAFKDQFKGLDISKLPNEQPKVKKDQGTIEAITAATISSRAFCDAVQRAYQAKKRGDEK